MDRINILESDKTAKVIASLSIPTVMITLIMAVYNMADVFFISKTNNTDMINSIAVCMPVFTVIQAFGTLIGTGCCTAISVSLGRGDKAASRKISSFGFWFSCLLGILLTVVLFCSSDTVIALLGASESSSEYAEQYLKILALGCPVMIFTNAFVNILRADGSVKGSMVANMSGTILNIILDPLLILKLDLGVGGAAAATVAGNVLSAVIVTLLMRKKKEYLSFSPKELLLSYETSFKTLGLGLPTAVGTLLLSCGYMLMNNLLKAESADAQGAFVICRTVMLFQTMIQLGICMGVQPAVSYNYGKHRTNRMKSLIKGTMAVCFVFGTVAALICIGARDTILEAFIDDDNIMQYGRRLIFGCFITAPLYGIFQGSVTFLQATERPMSGTVVTVLRQGIILLPAMLILNELWGFNGLVLSFAVTDIVAAILGTVLLLKRISVLSEENQH